MKPRSPILQSTRLLDPVRERIMYMIYRLSKEKTYLHWHIFLGSNLSICYYYDSILGNKYAG